MRLAALPRVLPLALTVGSFAVLPTPPAFAAAKQITVTNNSGRQVDELNLTFGGTDNDVHVSEVKIQNNGRSVCDPPLITDSTYTRNRPTDRPHASNTIWIEWYVLGTRNCIEAGAKVVFRLTTKGAGAITLAAGQWRYSNPTNTPGIFERLAVDINANDVVIDDVAPKRGAFLGGGCGFVAVADQTDEQGARTWIELTHSTFVGTPDTTQWEVTCWLQTSAELGIGEIANTRHTCSGTTPAGACANPVIFEIYDTDNVYQCQHITWTGSFADDPTSLPFDLIDHLLRDVFSTGGITTLGGTSQITTTVTQAVDNLLSTLQLTPTDYLPGESTTFTVTSDYDDAIPGVQCDTVISA